MVVRTFVLGVFVIDLFCFVRLVLLRFDFFVDLLRFDCCGFAVCFLFGYADLAGGL